MMPLGFPFTLRELKNVAVLRARVVNSNIVCTSNALGIAFPALIELCLFWPDKFGCCRWILFKDILIILCGIFGLVIGTYTSLLGIITSML
uniref:Uncharacterized protein n=1 Tax=Timema bartmani TaxID=61472 RepID=A0A7R9F3N3_9NEOP|nr:unnamed protein product [Timema bartmani]